MVWSIVLAPSLGLRESQDALYVADRERSCVLVLLLSCSPREWSSTTLHTREKALHYCVELQTEEQEVRISQKK